METQHLHLENQINAIAIPAKADIALKVLLFIAILACINMVAFM